MSKKTIKKVQKSNRKDQNAKRTDQSVEDRIEQVLSQLSSLSAELQDSGIRNQDSGEKALGERLPSVATASPSITNRHKRKSSATSNDSCTARPTVRSPSPTSRPG